MKLNKLLLIGFSSILLTAVGSAEDEAPAKDKKGPKGPPKSFEELDADKDGKISEVEFIGKRKGKGEEKAKAHFKEKDKDADGFLSKEEFAKKGKGKKGPKKPKKKKKDE
ncbi:MAG: hypothetical protein QMC23_04095 [Rubritalea sp.]|jgi:hypothetical protein|tara:strand:- start:1119 stop:1448 length:330 start_codon:yes stop_codon:yes gene_type:complete